MVVQSFSQIATGHVAYWHLSEIIFANLIHDLKNFHFLLITVSMQCLMFTGYLMLYLPFRIVFKMSISVPCDYRQLPKGRYLIVANHSRRIDGYLIQSSLPIFLFMKLLPIRTFTANVYLRLWWQKLLLLPFGCFHAYSQARIPSGVKEGLLLSDKGHTLLIFPEGKRAQGRTCLPVKPGVGYLAQWRNFTILPVHISYNLGRKKLTCVRWGKPFKASHSYPANIQELSNEIFSQVTILGKKDSKLCY